MSGKEPSNPDLNDSSDIYFDETVERSFENNPRETIQELSLIHI